MCGNGVWLEEGEGEKIGRTDYFPSWSTTTSFTQIGEKIRVKMRSKNSLSFWTNNPLILNKKLNQQCFQAPWLFTQPRSRSSLFFFFFLIRFFSHNLKKKKFKKKVLVPEFLLLFFCSYFILFYEVFIHIQFFNKNIMCYLLLLSNIYIIVNFYQFYFLPSHFSSQPNKKVFHSYTFPSSQLKTYERKLKLFYPLTFLSLQHFPSFYFSTPSTKWILRVCLVEGVEKWEDRKNFIFFHFCLVGSGKVKRMEKMSLNKFTHISLLGSVWLEG